MNDVDDLVTVRTYTIPMYADTDRIHLEAAGIPAFVVDSNIVAADYFLGNAIGYVKLQVPRARAEEALDVLSRHQTERHAFSGDPVVEPLPPCLACGEFMGENDERCAKCGWSFADGAEVDEPA